MKTNHRRGYVAPTVTPHSEVWRRIAKDERNVAERSRGKSEIRESLETYHADPLVEVFQRIHEDARRQKAKRAQEISRDMSVYFTKHFA